MVESSYMSGESFLVISGGKLNTARCLECASALGAILMTQIRSVLFQYFSNCLMNE